MDVPRQKLSIRRLQGRHLSRPWEDGVREDFWEERMPKVGLKEEWE